MIKYSFIVPVYNTEKYLKKCLDSILKQKIKDYEIIVVNDGSTDNSEKIIKGYLTKKLKYIYQKNEGLSSARNTGVLNATGKFLIFVDSDDFIDQDFLEVIDKNLKEDIDVLRYQIKEIYNNDVIEYHEKEFNNLTGYDAFSIICKYHFVENSWAYVYNRKFWLNNNFAFTKGIYHEDFALTPLILMKAKSVSSIDYLGYNYAIRKGSIMSKGDYEKEKKKCFDVINATIRMKKEILNYNPQNKELFLSFIANCAIEKARVLNKEDFKKYQKILKENGILNDIIANNIVRKLKKIIINLNLKFYLKLKK